MTKSQKPGPSIEYRGTGFYLSLGVICVLGVGLLVLSVQNTKSVQFEFLWWNLEIPLFGLIIAAALLAIVLDQLIGLAWRRIRRGRMTERQELGRLRREAQENRQTAHEAADEPSSDGAETPERSQT